MAITVEDGTGKSNANCYSSVASFTARNSERGTTLSGTNGSPEQLLLGAMDYIEAQEYQGLKNTKAQSLQWPRSGVYIDGFAVEETEIPAQLINALYETAVAIDTGDSPLATVGRETKKEKVGDIEVEYMDNAKADSVRRAIDVHLQKLLSRAGGNYVELMRA